MREGRARVPRAVRPARDAGEPGRAARPERDGDVRASASSTARERSLDSAVRQAASRSDALRRTMPCFTDQRAALRRRGARPRRVLPSLVARDGDRLLLVNLGRDVPRATSLPEPLLAPPLDARAGASIWSSEHPDYGGHGTPEPFTPDAPRDPGATPRCSARPTPAPISAVDPAPPSGEKHPSNHERNRSRSRPSRQSPEPRQEWLVANGLGGYASGTVLGVPTRRYHGLLDRGAAEPGRPRDDAQLARGAAAAARRHARRRRLGAAELRRRRASLELVEFRLELGLPVWRYAGSA